MKKLFVMLSLFAAAQLAHAQYLIHGDPSVTVITYHRVSPNNIPPTGESITIARFEEHLKMIKEGGYTTYTASELAELMKSKQKMPEKAVALTFDDGWESNLEAQKLLEKYNLKGTFYVLSGYFEAPRGYPAYLTRDQLRELASKKNVEIGSHTHTHFLKWADKMHTLTAKEAFNEMRQSKTIIEETIGKRVYAFAWPFGHVVPDARDQAASIGYTSIGEINSRSINDGDVSPFRMQRLNIDGKCTSVDVKKMIDTGMLVKCVIP